MIITNQDEYLKHGCTIKGDLVVIDYSKEWQEGRNFGKFGAMSVYDALDLAKKQLFELYPEAEIVLAIPDLVAKV